MHDNVTVAFGLAIVLFVLLLVLGVTSFNMVKKRMKTESWKRLQRLSYVFFALVYAHLLLMLLPSALHGAAAPQANVAVYSVVFVGYFVLRLVRFALDRRAEGAEVAPAGSDGDGEGAEVEAPPRGRCDREQQRGRWGRERVGNARREQWVASAGRARARRSPRSWPVMARLTVMASRWQG